MLSEKSNNNKEYYSPSLSLNGEILEREDFNNTLKIEKIIEENENLKQQLKMSRNKINNLEEILEKMIKESLPLSKEECPKPTPEIRKFPIPKKTKCQRIINYSREKDGEKITKYVRSPEDIKKYEEYIIMKQFGN
jgi:L-lysine 2,3-aminomutase